MATLKKIERLADVAKRVDKALDKAGCSFDADTLVLTEQGLKRIADVSELDRVLARNEQTGEQGWQPVLAQFVEWHANVRVLTLEDVSGGRESLVTTDEHPFFRVGDGWRPSIDIAVGDTLVAAGGKLLKVIHNSRRNIGQDAYNLTVANDHTYFVGHSNAWVHNACDIGMKGVGSAERTTGTIKELRQSVANAGYDREKLTDARDKLTKSIGARKAENEKMKPDSEHTKRISQERELLEKVERRLRELD